MTAPDQVAKPDTKTLAGGSRYVCAAGAARSYHRDDREAIVTLQRYSRRQFCVNLGPALSLQQSHTRCIRFEVLTGKGLKTDGSLLQNSELLYREVWPVTESFETIG
jgi:hypothetical protein